MADAELSDGDRAGIDEVWRAMTALRIAARADGYAEAYRQVEAYLATLPEEEARAVAVTLAVAPRWFLHSRVCEPEALDDFALELTWSWS